MTRDYVTAYDVAQALGIPLVELSSDPDFKVIPREQGTGRLLRSAVVAMLKRSGIPESRLGETDE